MKKFNTFCSKRIFFVFILLFLNFLGFSQSYKIMTDSEASYQNALFEFENGEYGKALQSCENALVLRRSQKENEALILRNSLSSQDAIRAGDSISDLLVVLKERGENNTISIITYYQKRYGEELFENSVSKLAQFIDETKVFPEVLSLIGDIFKIEGEFDFADEYYRQAYENSDYLDVQDSKYEILYKMAEISRLKENDDEYETRLLNIVKNDKNFTNSNFIFAMKSTIKKNNDDSVEKFFELYRSSEFYAIKAYSLLADYYLEKNKNERALEVSALCAITGFTKIIDTVSARDITFTYDGFEDLLVNVNSSPDLVEWGIKNDVWKSFNVLSQSAGKCGCNNFQNRMNSILSRSSPEKYWQEKAVLDLQRSFYEN